MTAPDIQPPKVRRQFSVRMSDLEAAHLSEAAAWNQMSPSLFLCELFRIWVTATPNRDGSVPLKAFNRLHAVDPGLITIEVAAEFLSRCGATLDTLASTGGFPTQRGRDPFLFSVDDMFAWLARAYNSVEPSANRDDSVG